MTKNAAEPAVQYLQMDKSYKAVIKRGNDYNIIQDTVLFTVPDLEENSPSDGNSTAKEKYLQEQREYRSCNPGHC